MALGNATHRVCGIMKHALREDDPGTYKLRLTAEDVGSERIDPGLYSCSREAFEKYGPTVIERLKRTPKMGHDGKLVIDEQGKPVMTLPADATLHSVAPSMLC